MHFHLPKPLHGWREFVGEVGIIVLGVLIAISAEQTIEAFHSRQEIHDATTALNQELALDYGSVVFRHAADQCVMAKLDQIQLWTSAHPRRGSEAFPSGVGRPGSLAISSSVWDIAKSGQVASKMPLVQQLQYGQLYGFLANFSRLEETEREVWSEMNDFTGLRMDDRDVARLRGLVMREEGIQASLANNYPYLVSDFRKLGIAPVQLQTNAGATVRKALCAPLTA